MESTATQNFTEPNVDVSLPKIIALGFLGVFSAAGAGYFLRFWLDFSGVDSLRPLLTLFFAWVFFLTVFVLQTLFLKSRTIANSVIFLESLALFAPFLSWFSWYALTAWGLAFLNLLNASFRGQSEMDNQMRIKFFRIAKPVISRAFTALSLFIALLYFNGPNAGAELGISKQTIKSFLKPSELILQNTLFKNFSFDMSVYQFVDTVVNGRITGQFGVARGLVLKEMRATLVDQGIAQFRKQLAPYGINFRDNDTIVDILYNYFSRMVMRVPKELQPLITLGMVFLVFLIVRSFGFLFYWVSGTVSYVLYEILMLGGFARLTLESRSREVITF